jgi:hypothetical protein
MVDISTAARIKIGAMTIRILIDMEGIIIHIIVTVTTRMKKTLRCSACCCLNSMARAPG